MIRETVPIILFPLQSFNINQTTKKIKMKYLSIIIILLIGFANPINAQDAITNYFDKYMEDERFTVVYISPKMFELFAKVVDDIDTDDPESKAVMDIAQNIKGLMVLTTDEEPKAFYKEAMTTINTKSYDLLMSVRDEGENVRFYTKDENGADISELLLLVGSEDEFVMVSFVGEINLSEIAQLANSMDVKGMEHLDKLEEEEIRKY